MNASFTITPVEKNIMRCQHTAAFQPGDVQALANFLNNYRGKLLIDLTGTTGDECSQNIKMFRPMMPVSAIFGSEIDASILDIPGSYYAHPVKYFKTEEEALHWLHDQ
ncbi:MAG: hypothetical protein H6634_10675 [Anaerolineales bacterium]|nr:hypothetical protein [Anaerolineales bacterium]